MTKEELQKENDKLLKELTEVNDILDGYKLLDEVDLTRAVLNLTTKVEDFDGDNQAYASQAATVLKTDIFRQECAKVVQEQIALIMKANPLPGLSKERTDDIGRGTINGVSLILERIMKYEVGYHETLANIADTEKFSRETNLERFNAIS